MCICFLAPLFKEIGELKLSPPRWRCQLGQTFACKTFSQTLSVYAVALKLHTLIQGHYVTLYVKSHKLLTLE